MLKLWKRDETSLRFSQHRLAEEIETQSNRSVFILLYCIDPDLLIYSISKNLHEHKPLDLDEDMIEDLVGKVVHDMFQNMYLTNNELKEIVNEIRDIIEIGLGNSKTHTKVRQAEQWLKLTR